LNNGIRNIGVIWKEKWILDGLELSDLFREFVFGNLDMLYHYQHLGLYFVLQGEAFVVASHQALCGGRQAPHKHGSASMVTTVQLAVSR